MLLVIEMLTIPPSSLYTWAQPPLPLTATNNLFTVQQTLYQLQHVNNFHESLQPNAPSCILVIPFSTHFHAKQTIALYGLPYSLLTAFTTVLPIQHILMLLNYCLVHAQAFKDNESR